MASDLAREALPPEGVLPLRVNEMTPSVIICAEGSRISIQWREQRPDQPDHDEYGRAEAMAAFLVEAANRAIGSGVKALEWFDAPIGAETRWAAETPFGTYTVYGNGRTYLDSVLLEFCEGKRGAQADFERRVLSCLSTHTAAGAGPVGEAVRERDAALATMEMAATSGAFYAKRCAALEARISTVESERDDWCAQSEMQCRARERAEQALRTERDLGCKHASEARAAEAALAETRAERDSWKDQYHAAANTAATYADFWDRHHADEAPQTTEDVAATLTQQDAFNLIRELEAADRAGDA